MKCLSLFALFAATLSAAPPTGPNVGSRALPFEARDQNGETHTLSSLLGPKGAILIFYRSADW
jgi:hypothetical protein